MRTSNRCICCEMDPCVCGMRPDDFDAKNLVGNIEKEAISKFKENIIKELTERLHVLSNYSDLKKDDHDLVNNYFYHEYHSISNLIEAIKKGEFDVK